MSRLKYVGGILSVIGLLIVGVPRLKLELDWQADSIFSFLWLAMAFFVFMAHWRKLARENRVRSDVEEALRREQWLEAQRQIRDLNQQHRQRRRALLQ